MGDTTTLPDLLQRLRTVIAAAEPQETDPGVFDELTEELATLDTLRRRATQRLLGSTPKPEASRSNGLN